jgi:hypothetical protein
MKLDKICTRIALECFSIGDKLECMNEDTLLGLAGSRYLKKGAVYFCKSKSCDVLQVFEDKNLHFSPLRFRKMIDE